MRPATAALTAILLILCLASTASAQGNGRGKDRDVTVTAQATVGFTSREQQAISAYFTAHNYAPETLPPGIVKRLARGKPLPPGIAKRSLPQDLCAQSRHILSLKY